MISLSNVDVVFGENTPNRNHALRDANLNLPKGQFVSVIDSNGAGKSTLLNAISGSIPIKSGEIAVNGDNVTRISEYHRARYMARVFQDPLVGTCGALTIEENMALAADRGGPRGLQFALQKARRNVYRDRLAVLGLGLEDRLTDRMDLLSGGQRQAVCLIMATLAPCEVILLDEHTAALDPIMADIVVELTDKVVREIGLTALMITHSMAQALKYGDRTIMMHRGEIILDLSENEKTNMTVDDLIATFSAKVGGHLDQDNLLL